MVTFLSEAMRTSARVIAVAATEAATPELVS
jgi:hypothetical protein